MATFKENLKQTFANFKTKYIGNVPEGVTVAQINQRLTDSVSTVQSAATTYASALNTLFALIDMNKVTAKSVLKIGNSCYHISIKGNGVLQMNYLTVDAAGIEGIYATLSANSTYALTIGGGAPVDRSTQALGTETTLTFYY